MSINLSWLQQQLGSWCKKGNVLMAFIPCSNREVQRKYSFNGVVSWLWNFSNTFLNIKLTFTNFSLRLATKETVKKGLSSVGKGQKSQFSPCH